MDADKLLNQVQKLLFEKKPDQALVLCSQMPNSPLAKAFKTILEKSDRDDDSIYQAQDIALSENVPQLTKRIHYLSMLANVATLAGLLGTIHGLILSFAAVGAADASQKQALLANGISVSMYTTALGLIVAIPAMVFYSILVSKQNELLEQMTEKCGKLVETLTTLHLPKMGRADLFPDSLQKEEFHAKAPPTGSRAS